MASQDDPPNTLDVSVIEEILEEGDEPTDNFKSSPGVEQDDDEDFDETFGERLWGLTEMFPDWLRSGIFVLGTGSVSSAKHLYGFSRSALWIFFSSSAILMAPVIFEVERAQMEEMHKQQQRQIILGPKAALAGSQPHFPVPMPSQSR